MLKLKGKKALKKLNTLKEVIKDYEKEILNCSEEPYSMLFYLNKKMIKKVKELEKENLKVFHVIKGKYRMSDETVIKMNTYLLVSKEVEEDLQRTKNGYECFAYVENMDIPEFSEYGYVEIQPHNGGMKRIN